MPILHPPWDATLRGRSMRFYTFETRPTRTLTPASGLANWVDALSTPMMNLGPGPGGLAGDTLEYQVEGLNQQFLFTPIQGPNGENIYQYINVIEADLFVNNTVGTPTDSYFGIQFGTHGAPYPFPANPGAPVVQLRQLITDRTHWQVLQNDGFHNSVITDINGVPLSNANVTQNTPGAHVMLMMNPFTKITTAVINGVTYYSAGGNNVFPAKAGWIGTQYWCGFFVSVGTNASANHDFDCGISGFRSYTIGVGGKGSP